MRDEGNKVLVVHCWSNIRGRFIEVSVNPRNGRRRWIIILEEKNGSSWEKMAELLMANFLEGEKPRIPWGCEKKMRSSIVFLDITGGMGLKFKQRFERRWVR